MDNGVDSSTGRRQCRGQISDCGMLVCQNQLLCSCCILFHPRCTGSTGAIVITVHVRLTIPAPSAPFPDVLHCNSIITTQLYQLIVNFIGGDTFCQLKLNHTTNCLAGPSPLSLQLHIHLPTDRLLCHLLHVTTTTSAASTKQNKHISYRLGNLTC